MQKVLCYLMAIIMLFLFEASANAQSPTLSNMEISAEQESDSSLIPQLLSIRERMHKTDKPLFFLRIDVINAKMTVYSLIPEGIASYSLEEISTHLVGSPKSKKYPRGFGVITSIQRSPIWAPTPETVKLFKKRGINLEKFRNAKGKIIIPAGHKLNYMGPVKMNIDFLEKQASAKLERDVYRIHGTLQKDEKKLGTRCSGGCIRTQNKELLRLDELMKGGFIVVEYV